MAVKRKASPPPQAHSSNEYSSSDEEDNHVVSSQAKPPQRTDVNDGESESGSETDSDPDPPQPAKPTKPMIVRHKPSESEESSDEEDEAPPKKAEAEPEKKKPKLSASAAARIWSNEDEMALLRALSEYHGRTGKLPPSKDYPSFLASISGSIGFPVTEKQLSNKIRMMRQNYSKKKEKGTGAKISKPHDKAVFDMSTRLFNDSIKPSKKRSKVESTSDTDTDNGDAPRSNLYLQSFIEEKIREHKLPSWLKVDNVVARFGELTVQKMNAKIKDLRIEAMELHAKEANMNVELFTAFAEVMAED